MRLNWIALNTHLCNNYFQAKAKWVVSDNNYLSPLKKVHPCLFKDKRCLLVSAVIGGF